MTIISRLLCVAVLLVCFPRVSEAQSDACSTDLSRLMDGGGLTVVGRSAERLSEGGTEGVRLSASAGDGLAWLAGCRFSNGVIEFDVRGKDVPQQSFVGIAFHGANDSTYDAVYLRPFNFRAEDPARRLRAVQYISHPAYPWNRLREEHPQQYEKAVIPAPDPNGWVHVRVVVDRPKVSVFVGEGEEADLVVNQLNERSEGLVGLWVGNQSGGDFANLRLTPGSP